MLHEKAWWYEVQFSASPGNIIPTAYRVHNPQYLIHPAVFQESVLSPKAFFVIGNSLVDSRHLFKIVDGARTIWPDLAGAGKVANFIWMEVQRATGFPDPFYFFLSKISRVKRPFQCSDPPDRVYAFLAFQQHPKIRIEPKYALTLEKILVDTAATIIKDTSSLHILGVLPPVTG